jgi:hypothetical protein
MWVALAVGLLCGAAFTLIFQFNRVPGRSPIKKLGGLTIERDQRPLQP